MQRLSSNSTTDTQDSKAGILAGMATFDTTEEHGEGTVEANPQQYHLYKRRFVGLGVLVLQNIMVSWCWLTFAAVSTNASQYLGVTISTINWISTAFLFAFVPMCPVVMLTLNKFGPKTSMIIASVLLVVGNWVRYAGIRVTGGSIGVIMFGQIIIGFSQPFVLAAPSRYSNLWFSDIGRVTATGVASLANPLGGAIGQLVCPALVNTASDVPNMVLYVAIIATVAAVPAFFVPSAPPSPPSAIAASEKLDIRKALPRLWRNGSFYLIYIPFAVYVGFFNAFTTLLNTIFEPYGFSETEAGIVGAILIVVGLIASAIVSPQVDRRKRYALVVKIFVPLIATSYLVMIFMPGTRSVAGPYIVAAFLGASSFSLLPTALEYLVIVTHPISPEITSVICWATGQLFGAIFIVIMDALRGGWSDKSDPPDTMIRGLIFEAIIAWLAVPFPFWLGTGSFKHDGLQSLI